MSFFSENYLPILGVGTSVSVVCILLFKNYMEKVNYDKFTLKRLSFHHIPASSSAKDKKRNVLVTGGQGFLGKYIVNLLLKENDVNIGNNLLLFSL